MLDLSCLGKLKQIQSQKDLVFANSPNWPGSPNTPASLQGTLKLQHEIVRVDARGMGGWVEPLQPSGMHPPWGPPPRA